MKFIKFKTFEIAVTPVTQAEYAKTIKNNPSRFKGQNNPVENVSWNDAKQFIEILNKEDKNFIYRFPTAAEWDEALGKKISEKEVLKEAWCYENSKQKTHPVKKKKPNEFGLYDMRGNVWEWCEDEIYGSIRVVHGGSWRSGARGLRSASRSYASPGVRGEGLGFRLVRTPVSLGSLTPNPHEKSETREAIVEEIETHLNFIQSKLEKLK